MYKFSFYILKYLGPYNFGRFFCLVMCFISFCQIYTISYSSYYSHIFWAKYSGHYFYFGWPSVQSFFLLYFIYFNFFLINIFGRNFFLGKTFLIDFKLFFYTFIKFPITIYFAMIVKKIFLVGNFWSVFHLSDIYFSDFFF